MSASNIIQQDNRNDELEQLVDKIVNEIEQGRMQLAISINTMVKNTYWNVGRYIVEFEQKGGVTGEVWQFVVDQVVANASPSGWLRIQSPQPEQHAQILFDVPNLSDV